jgi:MFS family permease
LPGSGSEIGRLLRRPGYARYFFVVAAARATATMFNVAGVLLVLQRTGSLVLAGVTVAASTLPGAITGPFLGAWLDIAKSRRRLLVLDRVLTAGALAALLLLVGHAPNWSIPLVAVLYGAFAPLSDGAFSSLLPEIAGPELLDVANTFEASSINTAFIVGPALAGLISSLASAAAAVETQIAIGLLLIPLIAGETIFELRPARTGEATRRLLATVSEGMRSLVGDGRLRSHALASVIAVTAWGALNVGFPVYAERVHASASASGYMWAALSLASMVSAFVFRKRALKLDPRTLICGSYGVMALSVLLWPLVHGLAGALALVALTGALEGPSLVAIVAVRQRLAPPHLRGQIMSTVLSLDIAAFAIGSAAAGPLHAAAGTVATLYVFGGLLLFAGVANVGIGAGVKSQTAAEGSEGASPE